MTLSELIASEPSNASRTDLEVMEWLLEPSGTYEELLINERKLYADLGPTLAEGILQALEAAGQVNPVVKRALKWLEPSQGGLALASVYTRGMIAQLQAMEVLTSEQANALLGMPREFSRAESIGIPDLTFGMVEAAR